MSTFFQNCCGNLPGDRHCCWFGCLLTLELSAVCSFCSLGFIHYAPHQCWIWLWSYWLPVFVYNIILSEKKYPGQKVRKYHRKPKGRGKGTLWISYPLSTSGLFSWPLDPPGKHKSQSGDSAARYFLISAAVVTFVGLMMMTDHLMFAYLWNLRWMGDNLRVDVSCAETFLCFCLRRDKGWAELMGEVTESRELRLRERGLLRLSAPVNLSESGYCIISEATFPPSFELLALLMSNFSSEQRMTAWGGGRGWASWHFWGSQRLPSSLMGRASWESLLGRLLVVFFPEAVLGLASIGQKELGISCPWGALQLLTLLYWSHTWVESPVASGNWPVLTNSFHCQHPFEKLFILLTFPAFDSPKNLDKVKIWPVSHCFPVLCGLRVSLWL